MLVPLPAIPTLPTKLLLLLPNPPHATSFETLISSSLGLPQHIAFLYDGDLHVAQVSNIYTSSHGKERKGQTHGDPSEQYFLEECWGPLNPFNSRDLNMQRSRLEPVHRASMGTGTCFPERHSYRVLSAPDAEHLPLQ